MRDQQLLRPADHVLADAALLDEETIRVFHGQELIIRKFGEHNRREIV